MRCRSAVAARRITEHRVHRAQFQADHQGLAVRVRSDVVGGGPQAVDGGGAHDVAEARPGDHQPEQQADRHRREREPVEDFTIT